MLKIFVMIFFVVTVLAGCSSSTNQQDIPIIPVDVQELTTAEAHDLWGANPEIKLIDVRSANEFSNIHIPGSTLLPAPSIEESAAIVIPDKETTIFVICQSGNRSRPAAKALTELGYTNVYDVGGILSWPGELVTD